MDDGILILRNGQTVAMMKRIISGMILTVLIASLFTASAFCTGGSWDCDCGAKGNTQSFCPDCGSAAPADRVAAGSESIREWAAKNPWTCKNCDSTGNTGLYCPNCGSDSPYWECPNCGTVNGGNFCPNCRAQSPYFTEAPAVSSTPEPTPEPTPVPVSLSLPDIPGLSALKKARVGDTVFFGTYPQDDCDSYCTDQIEWLVLDRQGDELLLISLYGLECKKYHETNTDVTWENCDLRAWMNGYFYNYAFTSDEQARIELTFVGNPDSSYGTDGGRDTMDKVFALSYAEAKRYFSSDSDRQTEATDYAVSNGSYKANENGNCWWWLRTPGKSGNYATCVKASGALREDGYIVGNCPGVDDDGSARPALWLYLG